MIQPGAILTYDFGAPEQEYSPSDAILYALGIGVGADPLDRQELRLLDERDLAVLPTFAVTLCSPGMWIRDPALGVDFGKLVHSAQAAEFLAPLPPSAKVRGAAKVLSLTDRGEGRGAVLVLERTIAAAVSGIILCRMQQTLLLRGDGGFGGEPASRDDKFVPERAPDALRSTPTSQRAALIYRLSGDWNPLHFDPDVARAAGFDRPILHGLASYGMAGLSVSRSMDRDPASISALSCRFSGIILPGETVIFSVWLEDNNSAKFVAHADGRKVLDSGSISWRWS